MIVPRILVVDDEKNILKSYQRIFRNRRRGSEATESSTMIGKTAVSEENLFSEIVEPLEMEDEMAIDSFHLVEATQGEEAVEIVSQGLLKQQYFSLILLDVRMPPGIDGIETARRIRDLDPDVEIVIMTGFTDYTFEEMIKKIGSSRRLLYLHKPFNPKDLKEIAITLIHNWYLGADRKVGDDE